MDNHTLIKWPDKPFSGRFVYKSSDHWNWQCDMCYRYGLDFPTWNGAMFDALIHTYFCPHVNAKNRSYHPQP